jgi:flagellar hook assembly protein FlgD
MLGLQDLLSQKTQQSAAAVSGAGSSSGKSSSIPKNELNADSFITLLTAQLKAQDPLDPLKPQDMMNQLVSLNSLQELIQIRQLLQGVPGSTSGNGSATGNAVANANNSAYFASSVPAPSATYHDAILQQKLYPAQSPANLY